MLVRALAVALCLGSSSLPAFAVTPVAAQAKTAPMTTEQLMTATALDKLFTTFAETVAASPEQQGVPMPKGFAETWRETAYAVFVADQMHGALATAFEDRLSAAELDQLATFFRSDFGKRVTAVERAIQDLSTEDQLAARDEGIALLEDIAPEARRARQFDEIMTLVSAEVGRAMLGQAMRAMMVSMAVARASGDIDVPWDEIDAQVAQMMPGLEAEVSASQRALLAYAYQTLSDEELDTYIEFLRTPASRKFYAVLGYSVGTILESTMSKFGTELARQLNRVNV